MQGRFRSKSEKGNGNTFYTFSATPDTDIIHNHQAVVIVVVVVVRLL
jgi:hypothetical protein